MGASKDRFGTRLRDARLALGLTLADVSGSVLNASQLALIEAGRVQPDATLAAALAARVGIFVDPALALLEPHQQRISMSLEAALRRGDWQEATVLLTQDPQPTAHRSYCAAAVLERQGDFGGALALLDAVVDGLETPPALRWRAIVASCRCARYAGQLQRSVDEAEAALAVMQAQPSTDAEAIAELRATLAGSYCETGDLVRALDLTEPSADEFQASPWAIATQRWARSMVLQRTGQVAEAVPVAFDALRILATLDQPRTVARMQNNAAWLAMQSPGFDTTMVGALLRQSEQAFREVSAGVDLAFVLSSRAEFAVLQGDRGDARDCLVEALALAEGEDAGFRARITAAAAQLYASMGDFDRSMQHLLTARRLLEDSGARRSAAATWKQMAETYAALGHTDLQLACLRAAMELLDL